MKQTICWNCKKATGGCSWSDHFEHRPVDGWNAVQTRLRMNNDEYQPSYIVISCPEFEEDENGSRRTCEGVCGGRKGRRKRP